LTGGLAHYKNQANQAIQATKMETYVIHNVPYYYEPATNKLYVYNDTKLHIGSYDPATHNVIYRTDMPNDELATQLREWRATLGTSARSKNSS
jgi:hypothetical protein